MSRSKTLLLGTVGLVLILTLALYNGIEKIERDLKFRGEAVLAEHQMGWASLEVEGRTLRLLGEASSHKQANEALALTEELDGVIRVIDQSTLSPGQHTLSKKPAGDSPWPPDIMVR